MDLANEGFDSPTGPPEGRGDHFRVNGASTTFYQVIPPFKLKILKMSDVDKVHIVSTFYVKFAYFIRKIKMIQKVKFLMISKKSIWNFLIH